MTTPRNDRMYESAGKTRRSPPGGDSQSSGFFQAGQGGRTVLPPLSSAFPTSSRSPGPSHYSNPYLRSSHAKAEHPVSTYSQWPASTTPQQHSSHLYEHCDSRYQQAQGYPAYPPRTSPPVPPDSRKLPPLSVPPNTMRDDRWQGGAYGSVGPQLNYGDIRSPTATYPSEYTQYQYQSSYSYPPVPDTRGHPSQLSMHPCHPMSIAMYPSERGLPAQVETHGTSPYSRGPVTNTPLTQEPAPMLSTEEPAIKKKRKRADAAQLKVLNEVYARTAFPSTEERAELAKKLDMSARSVQIWFQNKRQSMRQTTRQASSSATAASQHQPFSTPSQGEASHAPYSGSTSPTAGPTQSYLPRTDSRTPGSLDARSSITPRREDDSRKWPSRY
ncbi:hypothetical protein F5141DRAFT_998507 [Pisolithus sp. B1]|nr:hypothetical protein F5141DRAFT_998507 [Pisolithus sp. B1]